MLQYLLYKIGMWLAINLPFKSSYGVASLIASLQYNICKKDRDAVINNLKVILRKQDEKSVRPVAKQVFINFAKYLVDFFRFSLVDRQYIDKFIKIEGREYLDEA